MSGAAAVPATLRQALEKLIDVTEEGEGYRALCPVHQGHSLLIKYKADEDTLLVRCAAGCDQQELVDKLRDLGVRLGAPRKRYVYQNAAGEPVFAKVRTRGRDGRRITFWECFGKNGVPTVHRRSKGGRDAHGNCTRCRIGPPRGMLYHLPEVKAALQNGDEIWLVEGEKDADALAAAGVCATTSMNGVDDWNAVYAEQLDGARCIIIVADNDASGVGKKGAYNRYLSLTDHAQTVLIRIAPGSVKDSAEMLAAGLGLGDFVPLDPDDLAPAVLGTNGAKHYTDPLPGEEMSDLGYAKRFVELYGDTVRYVPTWNRWVYWDGKRWRADELQRILLLAMRLVREMTLVYKDVAERSDDRDTKKMYAKALQFESAQHIRHVVSLASGLDGIAATPKDFDSHPFLLNCANGVFDLRSGQLTPHDPGRMLTRITKGAYNPTAEGNAFQEALAVVQPSKVRREYLGRVYGCALEGRVAEQMLAICHGTGANGKSTINDAVSWALGNYATEVDPRVLRGGERHQTEIAALAGRRLVFVEELGTLNEQRVKLLTSQSELQARRMREDPWTFRPSHNIVASTNEEPRITGADEGIWRRVRLISWDVMIADADQDTDLPFDLRDEADAVLTWLIRGYRRYRRSGISAPQSIRTENREFRDASDPVHAWIAERCVRDPLGVVTAADLRADFDTWRKDNGIKVGMSPNAFGRALRAKNLKRGRASSGNTWRGLRLRSRA